MGPIYLFSKEIEPDPDIHKTTADARNPRCLQIFIDDIKLWTYLMKDTAFFGKKELHVNLPKKKKRPRIRQCWNFYHECISSYDNRIA